MNQLAFTYTPLSPQCSAVLALIQSRWITVGEALQEAGVYALSQRIGELERAGYAIQRDWHETTHGKRVRKYRIAQ